MSFAKLDSGIVNSTLWVQPDDVLRVWVWLLSQADANGVVRTAAPALALVCMKSVDRIREIMLLLESPDPDSRSEIEEGRRLRKIPGGWQLINYRAYRERVSADEKRENDRLRIAEKRAAERAQDPQEAGRSNLSQPVANVAQAEAEAERASGGKPPSACTVGSRKRADDEQLESPTVVSIPLNDGSDFPITEAQVREFTDLYPAVDVVQALRSMRGWCLGNPKNRKTRNGALRFVTRWLQREQDEPRGNRGGSNATHRETPAERVARKNREAGFGDALDGECRRV